MISGSSEQRDTPPPQDAPGSGSDLPTRISGSPAASAEPLEHLAGAIPGYQLLHEIHRGGQGVVYRALQRSTKRSVALKVLLGGPFAGEAARRRFEREIELAASLQHPNIVTILDSGVSHERYYFAMEYIDGLRLDAYVQERALELRDVLGLMSRICFTVNFAHQRGVIHRDLKPSNILIDQRGEPRVLDFGLAKGPSGISAEDTTVAVLSAAGQVFGTLAYMSPEQAAGAADVDVRSDVYSLGVILYELLVGRSPYDLSGALAESLQRIARQEPVRPRAARGPSRFGRLVDDELETILLKALDKEPARRYQTAGDLGRDLEHYLGGEPIEAKRASGMYMLRKALRRYRWQASTIAFIGMLIVGSLAVVAVLYARERAAVELASDLLTEARMRTAQAESARQAERDAREGWEKASRQAEAAAAELRSALAEQRLQQGQLALERGDFAESRDQLWQAVLDQPGAPRAAWALREYYVRSGNRFNHLVADAVSGPVAFAPGGRWCAFASGPGVAVLDVASGTVKQWKPCPAPPVLVAIAADGRVAASGEGWLRIFDAAAPAVTLALELRPGAALRRIWLAAGAPAVGMIDGNMLRVIHTETGAPLSWQSLSSDVTTFAVSADGMRVAYLSSGELRTVRVSGSGALTPLAPPVSLAGGAVRALAWAGDAAVALLTPASVTRVVLRPAQRSEPRSLPPGRWSGLHASEDGRVLGVSDPGGRIHLLSERQGTADRAWRLPLRSSDQLYLTRDGAELLALEDEGVLSGWQAAEPASGIERSWNERVLVARTADDRRRGALLAADGTVLMYPERGLMRRIATDRGALRALVPQAVRETPRGLVLSADGTRCAVFWDTQIALLTRRSMIPLQWSDPNYPRIRDAALNDTGAQLALLVESDVTGQQKLVLLKPLLRGAFANLELTASPQAQLVVEGAPARWVRHIPGRDAYLLARSNGALLRVPAATTARATSALASWVELPAPAALVDIAGAAGRIAVTGDDGLTRILPLDQPERMWTLPSAGRAVSISLSADGGLLLSRTADDELVVQDTHQGAVLTRWVHPDAAESPWAAWRGDGGDALFGGARRVFLRTHANADRLIQKDRAFATMCAQSARTGAASRLGQGSQPGPGPAITKQPTSTTESPRPTSTPAASQPADRSLLLRAAHGTVQIGDWQAAYAGFQAAGAGLDGYSSLRLAECAYLLGHPAQAAAQLDHALDCPDLRPPDRLRGELLRGAALAASGDLDAARGVRARLEERLRATEGGASVGVIAALACLGELTERGPDLGLAATLRAMTLAFPRTWSAFEDDVAFFRGEAALSRGERERAAREYQRCLDLARDDWPVRWARWRIQQLSQSPQP